MPPEEIELLVQFVYAIVDELLFTVQLLFVAIIALDIVIVLVEGE